MLLTGCDTFNGVLGDGMAPPAPRPEVIDTPSQESTALKAYYETVEQGHRTRGLLRIDGGGPDVPFDAERLARTFMKVAFAREFSDVGASLVRREGESLLHRWEEPIKVEVIFGSSVAPMQRADDIASVRRFATRLERATGHPISIVDRAGNFRILFVSETERKTSGPLLRRLIPTIRDQEIDVIEGLGRESYCAVVAADPANDGSLSQAVAIIRSELPPLLRLSCIHEEMAQGLGLSNDSSFARPSIFNDDDEFGRLTAMDELMLGMLYDIRLRTGMDAAEARPIVDFLAGTLMGRGA